MAMERGLVVGLDEQEVTEIRERTDWLVMAHSNLPRIVVNKGMLLAERSQGPGMLPVDKVVFHSIYEDDLDFIAALALWGGLCLPNARAMMDCRLKLPCLVRALQYSRFAAPVRGYAAPHAVFHADEEQVAKWGNWHCGENKVRFSGAWSSENASIVEPFLSGQSVRIVLIGDAFWQIRLEGETWLKSIHPDNAGFMEVGPDLLDDTRQIAKGFGLELVGCDYIVGDDGEKHLLEVNHIPNVTRFPEIWDVYRNYVVRWLDGAA